MEFKYTYIDKTSHKQVHRIGKAKNVSALASQLKSDGIIPTKIHLIKAKKSTSFLQKFGLNQSVNSKEVSVFTRQLAATLKAGLLLSEALETIAEDQENQYLSFVLKKINDDIRGGTNFSSALARFPKIFTTTYIAIISSGEATGRLDHITDKLASYLEASERLKEKIKSAITYPCFVVGFAIIVIGIMVFFLIPKFKTTFDTFHAKLPMLTLIVMGVSEFAVNNVVFMLVAIIAIIVGIMLMKKNPKTKAGLDALILKIPLLGKHIIQKSLISQFCRTLGFLMAGGVSLPRSLEISSKVVEHTQVVDAIEHVKNRILSGAMMSDEIRNQHIFPNLVGKMVSVGERSGQVHQMLTQTAEYYDSELENSIARMTSLLEPILIVFIGANVLVVVLALYLPIFQMATVIK